MYQAMKILPALIIAVALSWARPAAAQGDVDAATVEAAKELMQATSTDKMMVQMLDEILPQMYSLMENLNPKQGALTTTLMKELFAPEMKRRIPELIEIVALTYARYFSFEEMEELAAFYDTPAGRKIIAIMPKLNSELMGLGSAWGENVVIETFREIGPLLRERGLKTPDI